MSLILCHSRMSRPGAEAIAAASDGRIVITRTPHGDVNWGRASASTSLNAYTALATNKHRMRLRFAETGVPAPQLFDLESEAPPVMVGRPDRHTKRRGFWLIRNQRDLDRALRGTSRKLAATHFQEFITAAHEYRAHIFMGLSIRISEKDTAAPAGSRRYSTVKPTGDVRRVRSAAKDAVAALGLDFGAVDVLALEDGTPYVLEVNTAPGLGGSMPLLWAETFLQWFDEREVLCACGEPGECDCDDDGDPYVGDDDHAPPYIDRGGRDTRC